MLFAAPPAHVVGLTLGLVGGFDVWGFLDGSGFPWIEWWLSDLVRCGVSCRCLSL